MFIICGNEKWEKDVRKKRRLKQNADFIAIYYPEDREWVILKDRWTDSGEVATEQEFENIVSEAMSKWAAESVRYAAGNNTNQGLPKQQQPHIDPSKVSQQLQQAGTPISGLNMTSSEPDSSDGEDKQEPEPAVKTDKLSALTSGSSWLPSF